MTITAFLPAIGYAGTVVTITGTDFVQVAEVKFNGTAALYFTIDSDVKITAIVPSGATSGSLSVASSEMTAVSTTSFTISESAARSVERHFLEAEDMTNDGTNWKVVSHDDGNAIWWYTGSPSRGKMLYGFHGGQGEATGTFILAAPGLFTFWVRYTDCRYFRGPFAVTLKQSGLVKVTKVYDSATLWGTIEGQAKYGENENKDAYENWVWISMPVLLQAGPVEIVLTKAEPLDVSWVTRLVDCFCLTTDLSYKPKIEDFATPLYMKVRLDAGHTEPCVIHMQGKRPRAPWYLSGTNFWRDGVVVDQYYTAHQPHLHFLSAGTESPWHNIAPQLASVGRHALVLRAMKNYPNDWCQSSAFTVFFSTTPTEDGIFKQFARTGTGYAMLINVDPSRANEAKSDLELSQLDLAAAKKFLPDRPAYFPIITGCVIRSEYQPATVNSEVQTLINLGYNGIAGYDPLFHKNGFTKIASMNYLYQNHWNGDCRADLRLEEIRQYVHNAAQPYIDAGVAHDVVAWFLGEENDPGSVSVTHIAGDSVATPAILPCPICRTKFRNFLQDQGLQPTVFGASDWDGVFPSNDPANQPKHYYHTINYRCKVLANLYKAATEALHEVVKGAKTTANFNEDLTFEGNMLSHGTDWFMNLREGALTYGWTENWLAYSATRQVTGYRADFLRSASPGGQFGMYNVLGAPWDAACKQVTNIGHGAKASYDYNFGPDWADSVDGSSSQYSRYGALHRMHAAIGRVDGALTAASVPPSKVALLYPRATDVWSLNDADSVSEFGKERIGLYLILRHLGYPVDIVTEEDIADGALTKGQYQMAVLSGSHVRRDAAQALVSWVKNGGRLYYNAGSLTYDEYNQPLDLDMALGIPRQAFVLQDQAGYEIYGLPKMANRDPFTYNGTSLEGLCGVQRVGGALPANATVLATFIADNAPALMVVPCGSGSLAFCCVFPGLAYQKNGVLAKGAADEANPNREMYGPPSFEEGYRSMFSAAMSGVQYQPPVVADHYLVEVNLLIGPSSWVISVANWTGMQRRDVMVSLPLSEAISLPYAALGVITSATQQDGVVTMMLDTLDECDFIVVPRLPSSSPRERIPLFLGDLIDYGGDDVSGWGVILVGGKLVRFFPPPGPPGPEYDLIAEQVRYLEVHPATEGRQERVRMLVPQQRPGFQVGGADGAPVVLREVLHVLDMQRERSRRSEILRAYGLAVQEAVARRLSEHGLTLELKDGGFDYQVGDADNTAPEDLALGRFAVSDWLIEVQATTGDEVALTPLQARAAGENSNRWVLCVVPLARIPEILEDSARLVAQVDASARIVLGVGPQAAVTSTLVHAAVAEAVSLRNGELLRYVVRRERWTSGMTIAEWVRRLAAPGGHAAASDAS